MGLDAGAAAIAQIPTSFYVVVGGLVLANLGTVVTIFYGIGKVVWFIAKLDARVESLEKGTSKDINAAHDAIRDLKEKMATQ